MKLLIFCLLCLSLNAQAQKSLSAQAFQSNIRPVLSGILDDFFQMISLFPDFPKDIVPLMEQVNAMEIEKENLRARCPRLIRKECLDVMVSIQKRLSAIDARTIELMAHQKMSGALHLNNISGMRLLNEFQEDLVDIKGEIDNSSFMLKGEVQHRKETYHIVKKLDELGTILSLTLVEYIPIPYTEDFRHFYFNFVHPVSKNRNYEFLNRNLNSLNFAFNLLNQSLTKRNKKTPEGMAPYLNLIHNRWNSLLRYYF